jgi:hypothetical protein
LKRADELAVIHALWTLDGLNALDRPTLVLGLNVSARVRPAAIRLCERLLAGQSPDRPPVELLERVLAIARSSSDPQVRVQCAFTLSAVDHPEATGAVAGMLARTPDDKTLRDAALSGLSGRELEALEHLLSDDAFAGRAGGSDATLSALAAAVLREAKPDRVERLLRAAVDRVEAAQWQQRAILSGMAEVARKDKDGKPRNGGVTFAAAPAPFVALAESTDAKVAELAADIEPMLHWPGKTDERQDAAPPLTAAQQKLFDEGKDPLRRHLRRLPPAHRRRPRGQGPAAARVPLGRGP